MEAVSVGEGVKWGPEKDLGESTRRAWKDEDGQDSGGWAMTTGGRRTVGEEGRRERRQEGGTPCACLETGGELGFPGEQGTRGSLKEEWEIMANTQVGHTVC